MQASARVRQKARRPVSENRLEAAGGANRRRCRCRLIAAVQCGAQVSQPLRSDIGKAAGIAPYVDA
ncbi:hypothetical protein BTJ_3903 [Burkholderia thailandensis E444]|nr:hypothetical protein BTJ_3903 [Burkholderia thailandensis E444]AIP29013.1 hypothetical protein DR63_3790 [Burkholderia thailandensis E264]AIT24502.1 hypothetical protein BTN_4396 [Burkholderia thailandensis E254]